MGSDSVPFLANLVLYYHERKLLLQTKEQYLQKARIFSNIFSFINGLRAFSKNEFENDWNHIYPGDLELKNENEDPFKASFLDLSIEVYDRTFTTDLFDKRDPFTF